MIPSDIRAEIEGFLNKSIESAQRVSGGSINQACKIVFEDGQACFVKWNTSTGVDIFKKEKKGLKLLRSARTKLRIPEVFGTGITKNSTAFLIQEFIYSRKGQSGSAIEFGLQLAELHKRQHDRFGLDHDNYIGSLPQSNNPHEKWADFFIEERLNPQLKRAADSGKVQRGILSRFEALYNRLPELLPDEPPALLHGDLWGGNYFYDETGKATVFDPAVYYGHREIEIAFTHLFGGFTSDFYSAYKSAYPLAPQFLERKDIYNLYPLLVHTNLFGGSYARQVEAIVSQF